MNNELFYFLVVLVATVVVVILIVERIVLSIELKRDQNKPLTKFWAKTREFFLFGRFIIILFFEVFLYAVKTWIVSILNFFKKKDFYVEGEIVEKKIEKIINPSPKILSNLFGGNDSIFWSEEPITITIYLIKVRTPEGRIYSISLNAFTQKFKRKCRKWRKKRKIRFHFIKKWYEGNYGYEADIS